MLKRPGIRRATREQALSHFLCKSAKLIVSGVALGAVLAIWASRAIGSQLYGVRATDPATYIMLAIGLAGVALCATWLPARRAAAVDPTVALRDE